MLILNIVGLFALLALPTIIAIHLFRRRFRPRPVTGLFLFGPGVRTIAAGRTPQRILWHASLLAELLAALAIAWYIIDPHLSDRMRAHQDVIVLDSRWRMATHLSAESLDQRVRVLLDNRLAALSGSDRVTIIASGATPSMLCGPAARPDVARAALAKWKPDRPWHSLEPAIILARSLAESAARVTVISDRLPKTQEANCEYIALGQPLVTSGIADVHWWQDAEGSRIVVRAIAYGGDIQRDITLTDGAKIITTQKLSLTNDQPTTVIFKIPENDSPRLTVTLVGPDPLPQDDSVIVDRPPPQIINVRLAVNDTLKVPLKRALAVISGVSITEDPLTSVHVQFTDQDVVESSGTWQVKFAVGKAPAVLGPFLQNRGHPLLRGLDFTGVLWSGGIPIADLSRSEQTPLILAGSTALLSEQRTQRDYTFTAYVDRSKSSVVDHPAWPAFLDNIISMRRAALPGCAQTTILSTQACRIIVPPGKNSVTVTRAEGQQILLQADRDGVVLIPPSDHLGIINVTLVDEKETWLTIHVIACDARMADLRQASNGVAGTTTDNKSDVERARSMLEHLLPILLAALCAGFGWLAFTREEGRAP